MAKITTGYTFGLTAFSTEVCRLIAMGKTEDEVLFCKYGITPISTPQEKGKAKRQLHKLMNDPKFQECYRAIVKEIAWPAYGKATQKLVEQIDNGNDWLANKAANDVITRFHDALMGGEDKQIVVKVEGMPVLGTPPAEETDGAEK